MNLFRPYNSGEPQRDERGRLVGIDRYQDVLGRNWKRFLGIGLITLAGFAPLGLGTAYAVLSSSVLVQLAACILGGAVAGPFLACLHDTILRALRDAPGTWRENLRRSFRQNTRAALLPGILTGLFLGAASFAGVMLFFWRSIFPGLGTILLYLVSWLLFFVLATLYWPQLVLFEMSNRQRLLNVLLFALRYPLPVLGAAALQLGFWLLMVLFAPWTLLILPVAGSWFPLFAALFVLYNKLDDAFGLEARIAQSFPEQTPHYDA